MGAPEAPRSPAPAPPTPHAVLHRLEWGGAVLLTLWTAWAHWLRFVHAGGLWRDEAAAARLANLPSLGEVWRLFPHEAFPLAVPLAVRAFCRLGGDGDAALRAFGLAVGLALAAGLWLNARWAPEAAGASSPAPRGVPLLALALVGGNAACVVFGDEVRGYGLGSLCILASFLALARLLERPGAGAATAALVAVVAAVHCLLANAALIAALCMAAAATALWRRRGRLALAVVGIGTAAALSLLPYAAPLAAAARAWNAVVVYPTDMAQVLRVLWATLGAAPARWVWLAAVLAGVSAAAWRVVAGRRTEAEAAVDPVPPDRAAEEAMRRVVVDGWRFSALTVVLALAAQVVFLKALSYTPRAWYYLPLLTLVAAALDRLLGGGWRGELARPLRLLLAVLLAAVLLPDALDKLRLRLTNADLAAARLNAAARPGDLVVVMPWYMGISFSRYYTGAAGWLTVPDLPDHRVHRYDMLKARLAEPHPIDGVLAAVHRALAGGHRVWLAGELRFPPPGSPAPILPPAPATPFGWHDFPYNRAWGLQACAFVRDHARAIQVVPLAVADPVNRLETLSALVAEGWRDGG